LNIHDLKFRVHGFICKNAEVKGQGLEWKV